MGSIITSGAGIQIDLFFLTIYYQLASLATSTSDNNYMSTIRRPIGYVAKDISASFLGNDII